LEEIVDINNNVGAKELSWFLDMSSGEVPSDNAMNYLCEDDDLLCRVLSLLSSPAHRYKTKKALITYEYDKGIIANKILSLLKEREMEASSIIGAIELLGELKREDAVDIIGSKLFHENNEVFNIACVALGNIATDECVEPLRKIAVSSQLRSERAVNTIGMVDSVYAIETIRKISIHHDPFIASAGVLFLMNPENRNIVYKYQMFSDSFNIELDSFPNDGLRGRYIESDIDTRKKINIFLSSTFDQDMRVNRDIFRNEINAKLNQLFGRIGYNVFIYDLELGVPDKTNQEDTLEICYDAIEECQYFVCVIGFNYGTLLSTFLYGDDNKQVELKSKYKDSIIEYINSKKGITESEIIETQKHKGIKTMFFVNDIINELMQENIYEISKILNDLLRKYTASNGADYNEFFQYIYENIDDSVNGIVIKNFAKSAHEKIKYSENLQTENAEYYKDYIDSNISKVYELKEKIKNHTLYDNDSSNDYVVQTYRHNEINTKIYSRRFKHSGYLSDEVEYWFKQEMKENPEYSKAAQLTEEEMNRNFLHAQKTRYYVEDIMNNKMLNDYLGSDNNTVLAIYGEEGSGKSSLLIDWEMDIRESGDYRVISYHIGANSRSASNMFTHIIEELAGEKINKDNENAKSRDEKLLDKYRVPNEQTLIYGFTDKIIKYDINAEKILIIISGFENIQYHDDIKGMYYLPKELPANVKMVISTSQEERLEKEFTAKQIVMPPMDKVLRRAFFYEGKRLEFPKISKKIREYQYINNVPQQGIMMSREIMMTANYRDIDNKLDEYFSKGNNIATTLRMYVERITNRFSSDGLDLDARIKENKLNAADRAIIFLYLCQNGAPLWLLEGIANKKGQQSRTIIQSEDGAVTNLDSVIGLTYHELRIDIANYVTFVNNDFKKAIKTIYIDNIDVTAYRKEIIDYLYVKYETLSPYKIIEIAYQAYQIGDKEKLEFLLSYVGSAIIINSDSNMLIKYMQVFDDPKEIMRKMEMKAPKEYYYFISDLYISLNMTKEAVEMMKKEFGHTKVKEISSMQKVNSAITYTSMAESLTAEGKHQEALNLAEKAVDILLEERGTRDVFSIKALFICGVIRSNMRDYKNGIEIINMSIVAMKEIFIDNHPDIAKGYNRLGMMYSDKRKYKKALNYFMMAQEIYKRTYVDTHNDIAYLYNNIALVYSETNRHDEAMEMYKISISILRGNYGEMNLVMARTYENVANALSDKKIYEEALIYYYKAIEITKVVTGAANKDVAMLYACVAMIHYKQKDYEKALNIFKSAASLLDSIYGYNYDIRMGLYDNIDKCQRKIAR